MTTEDGPTCEPTFSRGLFGNMVPRACKDHADGEEYAIVSILQHILDHAVQTSVSALPFEDDVRDAMNKVTAKSAESVERLGFDDEQELQYQNGIKLLEATFQYLVTLRDLGLERAIQSAGVDPDDFDWGGEGG